MTPRKAGQFILAASIIGAGATSLFAQPGEVVYNLSYMPGQPIVYGQQPPGYVDDLHLTRAGNMVSFTVAVYNGSSNTFVGGPGSNLPVDAVVEFFGTAPVDGSGFPGGSLIAQYIVPVPPPDNPSGSVWSVTHNLALPVALPQDVWVAVSTPGAMGSFGFTYAGPVFHLAPNAADVGSTTPGVWLGAPNNVFYPPFDYRQVATIRLAEDVNEPPTITCGAAAELWSPHHNFVDVTSSLPTIEDPDTPFEELTIDIMVVSDETEIPETGDGTGKHAPDFKTQLASGAEGFFLRSERRGSGNGRVYLGIFTVSDGDSTVTHVCVLGATPHGQDNESMQEVLLEAETRAAALQADIDLLGVGGIDLATHGLSQHGVSGELGPKQ